MNIPNEIKDLHEKLLEELHVEGAIESAQSLADMQAENTKDTSQGFCQMSSLEAAGIDTKQLIELEQQLTQNDDQEFLLMDQNMEQESLGLALEHSLDLESSLLPENSLLLTPSYSQIIEDIQDTGEAGTEAVDVQAVIGGGNSKNMRNWARGSGGGCIGGRASNTQRARWIFWFKPGQSRFYAIKPRFDFNGYYIAKANDKWFNCKSTQVKITAMTNVYQYNWKGWHSVDMVNINSQNINQNRRLDDRRYTNYSALLGKGDWAAVVCDVKLYVRAQGGGSYAKNDFATGANKVSVPFVVVN